MERAVVGRGGWVGLLVLVAGCGHRVEPKTVSVRPGHRPKGHFVDPKVESKATVLRIVPSMVSVGVGEAGVQLVVESVGPGGEVADRTGSVLWSSEADGSIAFEPGGFVRPIRSPEGYGGAMTVTAREGGASTSVRIDVQHAEAERPWDFAADIEPVLTRHGCNLGGCHGRAEGQSGFHLSFLGYDPAGDLRSIAREAGGRRVSPMAADQSLVLLKGSGQVAHGGGPRWKVNSDDYKVIRDWIAAGAPDHRGPPSGKLSGLSIEPADLRLEGPGPRQLRVVARYNDGRTRDVTRLANYRIGDDNAASIDDRGHAVLHKRAEVDVVVRYGSQVVSGRLGAVINPGLKTDFAKLPRKNLIDEELYKRLDALKVPPSGPSSDAAYLRRVSLDLTGQVPDPQQVREFLADQDPKKRDALVDRLLKTPDFEGFWKVKLGDLLQIANARFGGGAGRYQDWLKAKLRENAPWDGMVRELLTTLGNPDEPETAAAIYALDSIDPKERAELTAQRFLGLRLRCAQCHDHPFDVWTQDDYFGLAAFFAQTGPSVPSGPAMMGERTVKVDPNGQVIHLRTKAPAAMRLPDGSAFEVKPGEDPRKALAAWISGPTNPYFARAAANWTWAQLFGKGIADPADDLSRANPPVHPELLDALAKHFVNTKYDLHALIRLIATSNAYGASSATVPGNERDTRLFSHQLPRPLTAHQMADSLAKVTDVPNRYGQLGHRRAIEVNDPSTASQILDTFGRCPRTIGCGSVATPSLSLRQALLVIGGDVVDGKVASIKGYLHSLLELDPSPAELTTNLYLRALSRHPTDREKDHWSKVLADSPSSPEAAEDLFWALLNSREFAFNH